MAISHINRVLYQLRRLALAPEGLRRTDGQLLECFVCRREQAALEALVLQHGPMVWGVCRRLLNHQDAEDAFQATFLVLIRKAASIVPREMVGNWLYGVAYQTALNTRTRIARQRAREVQVAEMPEFARIEQDSGSELLPLLDQELRCLPDKYRVAVVLHDLEARSRKEVARQLGLPEGTVASRLARGRAMLATRLARHKLGVSSGILAAVLARQVVSACVPTAVVSSTINVASLCAVGQATTNGLVSTQVAALTEGWVKTMFLTKFKILSTVVLVALTCSGVCLTKYSSLASGPNEPVLSSPPKDKDTKRTGTNTEMDVVKKTDQKEDKVFPDGRDQGKPKPDQAKPALVGEVLKIGVDELLVFLVVETDQHLVYLTTEDKKKGDRTYRITNKTVVLRGDTRKRLRFADVRAGDRVGIDLDETKGSVRQLVVQKDGIGFSASPNTLEINSRTFKIPFRITPEYRNEIKKLNLCVSRDEGKSWVLDQMKPLADGDCDFSCTVPNDGVYWFAVQTVSQKGLIVPMLSELQPYLKVRVDTSKATR